MEKSEITFHSLLNKKIFYRDKSELIFDLKLFKEIDYSAYEEFLTDNPLNAINRFKKECLELLGISFQIENFDELFPISELRAENINTLVRVKGMITKTTKVVAYVEESKWECLGCGSIQKTKGDKVPIRCSCGNKKFISLSTLLRNLQEIEIEEPQDELEGKQPQKIRVRLFDELTDKTLSGMLQPGNKISILGIVEKNEVKKKLEETIFEYRVLALNVKSLDEQFSQETITEEDEKQIFKISANNPLDKLGESLAPSIYDNTDIKKTLILQMVGGVKKIKGDGSISRERIHILLVGDPGVAKTHLIKNVHRRMPKSYYISGDETTRAGLVAIVDKDQFLNEWALKVGALCKANNSILFIDEIDKMNEEDRESLHNPMESGEIVINKADIHTVLKADCSICAVANPKEGLFELDSLKTITQQINIPPPLMSRFDIIFVMTDTIDEKIDLSIAEKIFSENNNPEIPIELFRKYISYARKLKPKLNEKEMGELSKFYHNMRKKSILENSKMKGMPITPRHLEGLIRLSEASAKIRLSKFVEKQDVEVAEDIFYKSLIKLGLDPETGTLDMARIVSGKSLNKKQKARIIIEVMGELMKRFQSNYIYDATLKENCLERGLSVVEYEELIFELNKEGELLRDAKGWKLPTPQSI